MIANLITLGFLVLLQVVLGFDNLLYISLESKRAPPEDQARVRKIGIGLAILLRILLLFALIKVIDLVQDSLFSIHTHPISGEFNLHALIVLGGGAFIMYTAVKDDLAGRSGVDLSAKEPHVRGLGPVCAADRRVMLLSEGGHLAHMHLFGGEITAMSKATFYFVITVLVLTDLVQSRYQKKLTAKAQRAQAPGAKAG